MDQEDLAQDETGFVTSVNDQVPEMDTSSFPMVDYKTLRYNLRQTKDVKYSSVALPDAITTNDEPLDEGGS